MAKGKGLLKVTGILMIIGGALGLLTAPISCACGALAAASGVKGSGGVAFYMFFQIIASILELVIGIVGVANSDKKEKAKTCFTWGVVAAALQLISVILSATIDNFSFLSLITGLIVPGLFIVGAYLNMNGDNDIAEKIGEVANKVDAKFDQVAGGLNDKIEEGAAKLNDKLEDVGEDIKDKADDLFDKKDEN